MSPRRGLILLGAIVTGTFGGIGLAFFFEYLDSRIKTPEEFRTHLGLPSLGLVPKLSSKSVVEGAAPLISNGVPGNFSEAFRSLRTGVIFSSPDGKNSLVITSTGPGEGKSVVSANLAIGLAQLRQRVLLIDADMRRPSLHTTLGCDPEPGLSDLLVTGARSDTVVRKTSIPGLWLLPAGTVPPNPAELLGCETFKVLMRTAPQHFDWVLIDSPPVMAVTDAAVIAHAAAGIIFVVGADMTDRQTAQEALDQLQAARGRFVGGVLNRVDLERNSYYYSRYYNANYQQYYVQSEPGASPGAARHSMLQL